MTTTMLPLAKKNFSWEEVQNLQVQVCSDDKLRKQLRDFVENLQGQRASSANKLKLGVALWLLGNFAEAEAELKGQSQPVALRVLSHIYTVQERWKELESLLLQGVESSEGELFLYPLVKLYIGQRQLKEAKKWLTKLKKSKSVSKGDVLFLESFQEEVLGNYVQAKEGYQEVLELEEEHWDARFRLAYLEGLYGDDEEAIRHYEALRQAQPPYVNARVNLALLYEDRGQYGEAIKCLEEVLAVLPNHPVARLYLEDCKFSLNMFYDEDAKRQMDRRRQILRIPIKHFELSARAKNCLNKMNIKTLGDLIQKTEDELLSYKNFGENSLREIKSILAQHGLTLGEGRLRSGSGEVPLSPRLPEEVSPELLDRPVTEFQFNNRALNCMKTLGIRTLRDLLAKSEAELLQVRNFGKNTLQNIRENLRELGLTLRPE